MKEKYYTADNLHRHAIIQDDGNILAWGHSKKDAEIITERLNHLAGCSEKSNEGNWLWGDVTRLKKENDLLRETILRKDCAIEKHCLDFDYLKETARNLEKKLHEAEAHIEETAKIYAVAIESGKTNLRTIKSLEGKITYLENKLERDPVPYVPFMNPYLEEVIKNTVRNFYERVVSKKIEELHKKIDEANLRSKAP